LLRVDPERRFKPRSKGQGCAAEWVSEDLVFSPFS
jgi:hypothetical protein